MNYTEKERLLKTISSLSNQELEQIQEFIKKTIMPNFETDPLDKSIVKYTKSIKIGLNELKTLKKDLIKFDRLLASYDACLKTHSLSMYEGASPRNEIVKKINETRKKIKKLSENYKIDCTERANCQKLLYNIKASKKA